MHVEAMDINLPQVKTRQDKESKTYVTRVVDSEAAPDVDEVEVLQPLRLQLLPQRQQRLHALPATHHHSSPLIIATCVTHHHPSPSSSQSPPHASPVYHHQSHPQSPSLPPSHMSCSISLTLTAPVYHHHTCRVLSVSPSRTVVNG